MLCAEAQIVRRDQIAEGQKEPPDFLFFIATCEKDLVWVALCWARSLSGEQESVECFACYVVIVRL